MTPLLLLALAVAPAAEEPLVEAVAFVPDLVVDLRYQTADNFLKEKVYPDEARCLLRRSAAERLAVAAVKLRKVGFRVKVYDCYRPLSVQWKMWKILPKPGYVADPRKGGNHNRGAAVDLSLVTLDGGAVEMPTPFDTFSKNAHHGFDGGTAASRSHREVLREAMEGAGFKKNRMEWWHYDLPDARRFAALDQSFGAVAPPKNPYPRTQLTAADVARRTEARRAFAAGDCKRALGPLTTLLDTPLSAYDPETLKLAGLCELQEGSFDAAREHLSAASLLYGYPPALEEKAGLAELSAGDREAGVRRLSALQEKGLLLDEAASRALAAARQSFDAGR